MSVRELTAPSLHKCHNFIAACADENDITETLLGPDDERQSYPEPLLDTVQPQAAPRSGVNPFEHCVQLLTSGLNTAASSVGACVQWVLSGRSRAQLSEDEFRRLEAVRKLLRDKFDPENPTHQVSLQRCAYLLLAYGALIH